MAASKKEGILGKEKRAATCISKPNASITHGKRRTSSGSNEKQVANHLNKSTKSTSSQVATATTKNVKTIGAHQTTQSQRPNTLRRSFSSKSSTTSAPPVREPFTSPAPPHKPTIIKSASFSSLSTTGARKPTLARVAKNTIVGKPSTLSSMTRTRTLKKTPNACPTTKRGTTNFASKRTPITTRGKKEAKHENKENLNHQVEEVANHDDEGTQQHSHVVDVDTTTQVKSSAEEEQKKENETLDDISTVTQSNEVPRIEEMEDKFDEQKPDGSNNNDRHVVDKENDSKEEINVDHDEKENVPHEETKIEIHEEEANSVAKSRIQAEAAQGEKETFVEEAIPGCKSQVQDEEEQGKKETDEEEAESRVQEEAEQGKKERVEEEAESRVEEEAENGKKESPTPNSNVVEERKNRVRALVGAFETHR